MEDLLVNLSGFGNDKMENIGFLPFLLLMVVSFCSSMFISYLYITFYQTRATGSQVHRAFPLIGISITAIFISIQFSLPLSLGLLGALSIVRFRTPIKEPEEIGFIMLVVASSLCCATFNISFLTILLIVSVIALLVMKYSKRVLKGNMNDGTIIVTIPADEFKKNSKELFALLTKGIPQGRIDSIAENNDEAVISYNFIRMELDVFLKLQEALQKSISTAKMNAFYNRQGEI